MRFTNRPPSKRTTESQRTPRKRHREIETRSTGPVCLFHFMSLCSFLCVLCDSVVRSRLFTLHVVAEQEFVVAQEEFALGDDRVGPDLAAAAVELALLGDLEAAVL